MKLYQESNLLAAGYSPALGMQQQQSSHTQAQAVLGTYSPMASHPCSMVQVNTEHPTVLFFASSSSASPKKSVSKFEKCLWLQHYQLYFSVCREVFQWPIPKVKLWPRLGERQVAATWSPNPPTTAAATLPAVLASTPRPGVHSTDDASTAVVIILKFLCEFFFSHSLTPPPNPFLIMPSGYAIHNHESKHVYAHTLTYTNVPLYQSLIAYRAYQSCCIECIIYIHKSSFILKINYILRFNEMHCVNRINCCGLIDNVTFL